MDKRLSLIAVIISLIVLSWLFRYDIVTSDSAVAYRLDRWSGNVEFIIATEMERVERLEREK